MFAALTRQLREAAAVFGKELRFLLRTFLTTALRVGGLSAALVLCLAVWAMTDLPERPDVGFGQQLFEHLLGSLLLAGWLSIHVGVLFGVAHVVWQVVGIWIFFPVVLLPFSVILARLLFGPSIAETLTEISVAVSPHAKEFNLGGGHYAWVGLLFYPLVYFSIPQIPLLTLGLLALVALFLVLSFGLPLLASLPVLIWAYVRRLRRRHGRAVPAAAQ